MTLRNLWPFRRRVPANLQGPVRFDLRSVCPRFKRGDLVVCVVKAFAVQRPGDPIEGDVLRVYSVTDRVNERGYRTYYLRFTGKPASRGWCSTGFRHAALDHSAADAEFVAKLRDGRLSEVPAGEEVGA